MEQTVQIGYKVADAAALVDIAPSTMYDLIAQGTVPSFRIGGSRRVPVDWLEALGKSGKCPTGKPRPTPRPKSRKPARIGRKAAR